MGTGYAQTDLRWRHHVLGYGPALGTIGEYGCKLTTFADFATWAGWPVTPPVLDEMFVNHGGIFQRDPTGTFDFLPDNALALLMPDHFQAVGSWPGMRVDLIDRFLPSPDIFTGLWIKASGVLTHFFPLISGQAGRYVTDDSWDNIDKPISAYAGLVVLGTFAVRALHPAPPPKPVPQPPASQPPPASPPLPEPTVELPSEPYEVLDFVVSQGDDPDLHPMAGGWTRSQAITAANEWVADKPAGYTLEVVRSGVAAGPDDRVLYTAQGQDRPGVV